MQYKLVDTEEAPPQRFKFKDVAPDKNGIHAKSNGGTEQLYRYLTSHLDPKLLDNFQIICSRVRDADLDPSKKKILWLHDTYDDPESQHLKVKESRDRFDQLVFVSNYQFQTYHTNLGVPYDKSIVLKNAIVPFGPVKKPPVKDGLRLIYHTTPHRGLEILIPVFMELVKKHPAIHLDVYSSFKIYGWPERDEAYRRLFDACDVHPNITNHGSVSNSEVRKALERAHMFAFPSIWPETSCLAALESMSAGCAVVANDYAALPETLNSYGFTYRWTENKVENMQRFASLLNAVITNYSGETVRNNIEKQKEYIRVQYNWEYRLKEWEHMLRQLL